MTGSQFFRPRTTWALVLTAVIVVSTALSVVWPASGWASWMPQWFPVPQEDAYILYRYSDNLANGHGIVWNVGESPTDGATDFLWMLTLAAWAFAFGQVIPGIYILGTLLAITAGLIGFWVAPALRASKRPGLLLLPIVLLSPMAYHVVNGYGVPLLSTLMGASLAGFLVVSNPRRIPKSRDYVLWGAALLLTGLARPDANVFSLSLIAGHFVILISRGHRPYRFALFTCLVYGLPGAVYLVFRQFYFGEILPAPALVKIGGEPLWALFSSNLDKYAFRTLLPTVFFAMPMLFLAPGSMKRVFLFAFASILVYFVLFQLFRQTQNDSFRLEYPVVYLTALLGVVALTLADMSRWQNRVRFGAPLAGGVLIFLIMTPPSAGFADAKWPLAEILREYKDDGLVLATTEAGALPFISEWKVLDTYGLNDYEIARNGITRAYWDVFAPDVVIEHSLRVALWPSQHAPGNRLDLYQNMVSSDIYRPVAVIPVRRHFGRDLKYDYQIIFLNTESEVFEQLSDSIRSIEGETYAEIPAGFSERFSSPTR